MTGEDADSMAALSRYVRDGAKVLSDAAEKIATGPLSTRAYDDLAAACMALTTMFATRAAMSRAAHEGPERTD